MERDWDRIRTYLLAIEKDEDLKQTILADVLTDPLWKDQTEAEFNKEWAAFKAKERVVCGHLELLVAGGYTEGLTISRDMSGGFHFALHDPRLTNAGHDLLDSIRSPKVWAFIKDTAKSKSVDLTLDAVKALGPLAMKAIFGS